MGVGCYYVHADETASNPSHQFDIVEVDGNWYIVDPQMNDSIGSYWPAFLASEAPLSDYIYGGGIIYGITA